MEEKRIYYVGIDHGNHLMKTSNHVFENGVERQAVKPTFQANTLVYDGAFYKIGEKRNSVKDSKLADDDYQTVRNSNGTVYIRSKADGKRSNNIE